MKNLNSKLIIGLSVGFLSLIISGCGSDSASKNETKSFEGQKVEEIYIKTGGQNIELRPSSNEEIKVSMNTDKELPAKVNGNVLTVDIKESSDFINFKTDTVYVDVPGETYKKISLITTSGNIKGKDLNTEELTLNSDSGEIDIDGYNGNKIIGEFVASNVKLEGINGDLAIKNDTGNVSVFHKGIFENDSSISSNTGKVELNIESKPKNLLVDAVTESGKIRTSLFTSDEITSKGAGNKLKSEIGSGGPTLSIRSYSGDININ